MFCKNCGSQLNDSAKFCPSCGTKIEPLKPDAPVVEQPVAPVIAQAAAPAEPAKKKVKPLAIILPIVAVVLIAAIVIGIVFLGDKDSSDDKETKAATTVAGNTDNTDDKDNEDIVDTEEPQTSSKYYMTGKKTYTYDETGELLNTTEYTFCGKFLFPLSIKMYSGNTLVALQEYVVDSEGKITQIIMSNNPIIITYSEENGKQIGTGSFSGINAEVVFTSAEDFSITLKAAGTLLFKYNIYINDDGYSVVEKEDNLNKMVEICDGPNLIQMLEYERESEDQDFVLATKTTNTYNADNCLIETSIEYYEAYTVMTIYERNAKNMPTSVVTYEGDMLTQSSYVFEENGNVITLEIFDENGNTIGYTTYEFENKKATSFMQYNASYDLEMETKFNSDGLVTEEIQYTNGTISQKTVFEYEKM